MNKNFEFVGYQEVDGEKFKGVATIRLCGRFVVRYKMMPKKDGMTLFPTIASYRVGKDSTGSDRYIGAFTCDFVSEKEALDQFIRDCVDQYYVAKQAQTRVDPHHAPSAFNTPFPGAANTQQQAYPPRAQAPAQQQNAQGNLGFEGLPERAPF